MDVRSLRSKSIVKSLSHFLDRRYCFSDEKTAFIEGMTIGVDIMCRTGQGKRLNCSLVESVLQDNLDKQFNI